MGLQNLLGGLFKKMFAGSKDGASSGSLAGSLAQKATGGMASAGGGAGGDVNPLTGLFGSVLGQLGGGASGGGGAGNGQGISSAITPRPLQSVPDVGVPIVGPATSAPPARPEPLEAGTITNKRQIQDIRDKIYKEASPEEQRDLLLEGQAPVEHSALKRFLIGAGRGALIGMGSGNGIGGAIGGAAAGSLGEGFFPSANRRMNAAQERPRVDAQVMAGRQALETQAKDRKAAVEERKGVLDLVRTENKPLYDSVTSDDQITDDEAKLLREAGYPVVPYDARKFKTAEANGETYAAPELGVPVFNRTNLPADKLKVPQAVTTPTGRTVSATGPQILTSDTNVAVGDANRTQQAENSNAQRELDAQRANVANLQRWYGDAADRRVEAAKQFGANVKGAGEAQGKASQMQTAAAQMQALAERMNNAVDPREFTAAQNEYQKAESNFSKLQSEYEAAMKGVQGGQGILDALSQASTPKPRMVAAPKIAPSKVGRPVSRTKDPLGLFQ